jgi:phage host-nuclease inhibitor protein Gam
LAKLTINQLKHTITLFEGRLKSANEIADIRQNEILELTRKHDVLKKEHERYADSMGKVITETENKHKQEIAELKDTLNEIMPVLKRLLDWRIKHPLA